MYLNYIFSRFMHTVDYSKPFRTRNVKMCALYLLHSCGTHIVTTVFSGVYCNRYMSYLLNIDVKDIGNI